MKNLKMFAIAVMAFAVMAMGVRAVDCNSSAVAKSDTTCYTQAQLAAASATDAFYADNTITLLKDVTSLNADITISKNITIDLGNNATIGFAAGKGIKIAAGGILTLKGKGEIKNAGAGAALIEVQAGGTLNVEGNIKLDNESTANAEPVILVHGLDGQTTNVTVGKDATILSKAYGLVVGTVSESVAPGVTVTINGNWETEGYVAKVNGTIKYNAKAPVINVEEGGNYKSTKSTALYASGYATWNIKGGSVEGAQAVEVRSGAVNISGGTFKGTDPKLGGTGFTGSHATKNGSALIVNQVANYEDAKHIDLKVTGGSFTSEDGYAMYIKDLKDAGAISLSNVKMTSGKDGSAQLAAIKIDNSGDDATKFIANHNDMVVSGTFTGDVFEKVETSTGTYVTSTELAADLVKGDVKTEGGNTTVGTPSEGEGEQNPEGQPGTEGEGSGNQGSTENVKNPETNDNILVYAGLGLVSLASVAFTAKKRED